MGSWISFRTPIRGIRVGAGVSLPTTRVYQVSAFGVKVSHVGSALMLAGLAVWLFATRAASARKGCSGGTRA